MTAEISTVRDALAFARAQLSQIDEAAPASEARELLEWAADVESLWSIREPIAPAIVHRFIDGVERRMKRVPLQ
ncbi:peptide chain release factor N(5)-glutamine methyltransferase, partial [Pauljensenia sp. UMB3104]|nr:peptide chain release factor N(5)-glutamine methyltransferase [Pauljensenia sp. UMB3104]